jgi:hypothetical protein
MVLGVAFSAAAAMVTVMSFVSSVANSEGTQHEESEAAAELESLFSDDSREVLQPLLASNEF